MEKIVPLSVASSSGSKASRSRQLLCRWALKELLAKGYSRRAINRAIIHALKQSEENKLAFIKWVQKKPSYHQSRLFNPERHSAFVMNQVTPAIEFSLKNKGYGQEAIEQITGMMLTNAGDSGHCSIAKLWKSASNWPAAQS